MFGSETTIRYSEAAATKEWPEIWADEWQEAVTHFLVRHDGRRHG